MRYCLSWIVTAALFTSMACAADAAKSLQLSGKIDSVTVYRGQALVARVVELPAPGGLREIVVTDLPVQVVPGSLFAESADGTEVRSVLYRERAVSQDVREEVRKLDEQIRGVQDEQAANTRTLQTLAEQKTYLDRLSTFVAPTAQVELSKGVLNAETLKNLTTYQFEQRTKIADEELKLSKAGRDLGERLVILQRQRNELTGTSGRTVREAVVFASIPEKGGKLRLRYLVNNANWFPSYNVRAEAGAKQATLEYNASVQQQSGEDWGDVQMTLSTATPSLVAMAPALESLEVALASGAAVPASAAGYLKSKRQLEEQKEEYNTRRNADNKFGNMSINGAITGNGAGGQAAQLDADRGLNDVAGRMQVLEFQAKDWQRRDAKQAMQDETVSVTYQLANRTSLPSRQDMQLIQVATMQMPSEFYKLAAPVLSSYVYDQATLTNGGKMVLLAGPVASYLNGQFVGGGQVPTVAIGETFNVGFGIDSSLRATRELVEKTETVQAGNKVLNFNYHLTIENFGAKPATVRLTDRMPTSKDNDIKTTIESTSVALSTDASYLQRDRKKGILRWELQVPAQAIDTKASVVDFKLKLEFDRQMSIAGMPVQGK